MSKTMAKFYICIHASCPFETAKRKAIYTHLVRTHNERKEDYECEYCSTIFQDETLVEDHLVTSHPDKQFTYTCVSRIEHVINECAKNGGSDREITVTGCDANGNDVIENDIAKNRHTNSTESFNRTKASVNASLNNLAAKSQMIKLESSLIESDFDIGQNEDTPSHLISNPGSLKMKLNLKKIAECSPDDSSKERSTSPPKLEPASPLLHFESDIAASSPPNIVPYKGSDCVSIREKSSKYFDRLEVYHTTDEHGRRCCPFCPYKTTKNTIRVHLSGIHKIYFVKCSLCEYKAAFPHQVTQHGVKFHKTTQLNVIQLSKESRERTINRLNKSKNGGKVTNSYSSQSYNYSTNPYSADNFIDPDMFEEDDFSDVSSSISGEEEGAEQEPEVSFKDSPRDERQYKPPKGQMAKTDYFSIKVENGVHQYSCNLCPFQTPVRATIYTHKYRHEDKTYKCAYCDFISAPRSNVVHHIRSRHKEKPIQVSVVNDDAVAMETDPDNQMATLQEHAELQIKQEPPRSPYPDEVQEAHTMNNDYKEQHTIIKVPQYKRTLTSVSVSDGSCAENENASKRQRTIDDGYKLSLNKLYKVNPKVSPKYLCVECSYGCDTHPKMKHHLYRHRPQQYKCPYCDHRKYPRSYVVRHVRDTHRDKPVRVVDLSVGPEPMDIPEYMEENDEDGGVPDDPSDVVDEINEDSEMHDSSASPTMENMDNSKPWTSTDDACANSFDLSYDTSNEGGCVEVKIEPEDEMTPLDDEDRLSNSFNSTASIINNVNQTPPLKTNFDDDDDANDVSPNFSEVVYTSTPLIESLINGKFPGSTVDKHAQKTAMFRKKSLKDYRINYGDGPKYICNICGYGTENYKTIHNHMYRHESQKYQCPYCGYRRSPKSFVENHIREVHRGHPIFVTELKDELEHRVPLGSPRQCIMNLKKKEQGANNQDQHSNGTDTNSKDDLNLPAPSKLQIKWPAPKPASQMNLAVPKNKQTLSLQIPVRQKGQSDIVVPLTDNRQPSPGNQMYGSSMGTLGGSVLPPNVSPFKPSGIANVLPRCSAPLANGNQDVSRGVSTNIMSGNQIAFKFKEPSRTTFKTMYKCVFDPETCNHISKDKSKMKQHLFMHVEYKPWTCDFCDITASQSSHIKNHVRTEHHGVSDMSFKYKKHNYLEKHIDSFLTKGLFTVPVKEYRMIMDMKGNTKASYRTAFDRDSDGFVLCPHCDYRTRSGSMTDHVKMKHMQPRFKCHWCFYKAFYRSEIRRHHKKIHGKKEFRIQELDLKEVAKEFSEGKNEETGDRDTDNNIPKDEPCNPKDIDIEEGDGEGDEDLSDNEDLSDFLKYSTGKVILKGNTDDNPNRSDRVHCFDMSDDKSSNIPEKVEDSDFKIEQCESVYVQRGTKPIGNTGPKTTKGGKQGEAKFKCGYCLFSADLRMKVKMHCGKRHAGKAMSVIEPSEKNSEETKNQVDNNIMRVNCSELKGTRFEADLKKAGVSKLNLASLFPSKFNRNSSIVNDNETFDDESDDDDDDMSLYNQVEHEGPDVRLTIPFKKAPEPSKIKIPLSKIAGDKQVAADQDTFKKPMSPALPSKLFEKKKSYQIPRQNQTATSKPVTDDSDISSLLVNDSNISSPIEKEIVVKPLKDTIHLQQDIIHEMDETANLTNNKLCDDNQSVLHEDDTNTSTEGANLNNNYPNPDDGNYKPMNGQPIHSNILCSVHDEDNITLEENSNTCSVTEERTAATKPNRLTNDCSDSIEENESSTSIAALNMDMHENNFKHGGVNTFEPVSDSDVNPDKEGASFEDSNEADNDEEEPQRNSNEPINQSMGEILMDSVIHKTFPRGSPVVLEMEIDEEEHNDSVISMDCSDDFSNDHIHDLKHMNSCNDKVNSVENMPASENVDIGFCKAEEQTQSGMDLNYDLTSNKEQTKMDTKCDADLDVELEPTDIGKLGVDSDYNKIHEQTHTHTLSSELSVDGVHVGEDIDTEITVAV